jgi:TBC1 domain family protein 5
VGNPWNEYYADNDLKNEIRRDVDRTHQERELFCRDNVKELLTNVLFAWAKLHPTISYKQGMNELLAIMVFVGYAETEPFAADEVSDQAARYLRELNSRVHLEADCFWLFSKLMDRGVKELFNSVLNRPAQRQKGKNLFSWSEDEEKNDLVGQDKTDEQNASSVLKRCHRIHHRYLQAIDRELYDHLEGQSVEPQMNLLRWIRCLLSREFHLADVLLIWDSIFSKVGVVVENRNVKMTGNIDFNKDLVFLDFLCVSMIVFVRSYCNA